MQLNNNIQEKIKSVYNKKNYKNIEQFPILKHPNNLEGFVGKTSNPANGPSMKDYWNATGDIFTGDSKKKNKTNNKVDNTAVAEESTTSGNLKAEEIQFKELMKDQYKTTSDSTTDLYNSIASADLSTALTDTSKIKAAGESVKDFIMGDNKEISVGGESDKIKIIKNMILLPINFINNIFLYFCIVITQLSYKVPPIGPWGNMLKPLDTPNWPWKLNLDVSPNDNLALNKDAKLYDPSGASVPVMDGNIPAETYYENQKILYDSNILFGIFTQIILVCVTWVITNNAYYYIFIITPEIPYRIIEPFSKIDNKIEVSRGFGAIIYTIVNTIFCTPYDVITGILHMLRIIEFSKSSPFYGFRELTYILLFLIILYFVLTYFWDMYNNLMDDFFSFKYEPFFFIFIIYGLVYHYLFIKIVDEKHVEAPKGLYIKKGLSYMTIMSAFGAGYPVIRIMFFFWSIFIFFGLQGFGNDTYDDIYKLRSKDDCESNKFNLFKFIKKVIVFVFPYFFTFVIFVLLLSNLNYLNSQPTLNSNSSSGMKIIVTFIFIIIFLFFIFSILNKYILVDKKTVVFGKSFLNEKNELDNIINKSTTMKTYENLLENTNQNTEQGQSDTQIPTDPNQPAQSDTQIPTDPNQPAQSDTQIPTDPNQVSENQTNPLYLQLLKNKIEVLKNKLKSIESDEVVNKLIPSSKKQKLFELINTIEKIENNPVIEIIFQVPFDIKNVYTVILNKLDTDTKLSKETKDQIQIFADFLNQLIYSKIDENITEFVNDLIEIDPTKNTLEYITEVEQLFKTKLELIRTKLAAIIKQVYTYEINIIVSFTQIYNTPGVSAFFIEAEPEVGIICKLTSLIFVKETKASILNAITNAKNVVTSIIRK